MKIFQCIGISFLLILTQSISAKKTTTPHTSQKNIIVFDLTNIVIKENQIGFAKKIGYGTLASYAITHWKNPGHRCLDMLHEISNHESQKPHITLTLQKRTLPRCLVELQEGKKTCAQAKEEIMQAEELYATAQQKFPDVIEHFDGIVISSHIKTIKPGDEILKHLIETHKLNPADCIVIEDQEEAATTAKKLGMQAIVCDKPSHLASKLKKCGVKM